MWQRLKRIKTETSSYKVEKGRQDEGHNGGRRRRNNVSSTEFLYRCSIVEYGKNGRMRRGVGRRWQSGMGGNTH